MLEAREPSRPSLDLADVRNKLSPITTLITMLEHGEKEMLPECIKQAKISVNYLANSDVYNLNEESVIMPEKDTIKYSKLMSKVLRHDPALLNLDMDTNGWVSIDQLMEHMKSIKHMEITRTQLFHVVANNDKKRFVVDETKTKIRANQGHSINVDLQMQSHTPPDVLYHGTATRFIDSIKQDGIKSMSRNHVHLSTDPQAAIKVGSRHGKGVALLVRASDMHADGIKFYKSENGVWLTEFVHRDYLDLSSIRGNYGN